ncbi:MAG: tRNA uridine-5-carboxymethylaminomethyl(34) synthesis GTPase MnmE [Candidatus Tectomicrobia bacterium]|uniref:tRNA modification GTPase MnmE n=1 Tax=Tectimicrobiota bacterium TaxID=2528274 RepID=A0A932MQ47_UNCTE|nr:tRNA uridine-5-carboxymethylaminomethyl(34) synthesis GTPase MnmE [Candidatus Tectomicrobia bacterium]
MVAQGRDTIVALSSGPGRGAIAVVRLSGPGTRGVLSKVFLPKPKTKKALPARRLVLGRFVDAEGRAFDEGMAAFMPAPGSFTGEDLAELYCHGGPAILEALIEAARTAGARPAAPGEFTKRAFLAGKVDLVQSEAVADLICAETRRAARAALHHLEGGLSRELESIWERIVEAGAHLEAAIDFPEEFEPGAGPSVSGAPMGQAELGALFGRIEGDLQKLEASYRAGRALREGARVAILGRPNAGKSTLINRLLGMERAIVSPLPGTTRDTVEEVCDIGGVPVRLIDTAGLRETGDAIEREGAERARRAAAGADLRLLLLDASAGEEEAGWALAERARLEGPSFLVANKMDLPGAVLPEGALAVSALKGDGMEGLREAIAQALAGEAGEAGSGQSLLTRERHRDLVARCRAAVGRAREAALGGVSPELVAVHLNEAQAALAELLGRNYGEALLDRIFETFCVGK